MFYALYVLCSPPKETQPLIKKMAWPWNIGSNCWQGKFPRYDAYLLTTFCPYRAVGPILGSGSLWGQRKLRAKLKALLQEKKIKIIQIKKLSGNFSLPPSIILWLSPKCRAFRKGENIVCVTWMFFKASEWGSFFFFFHLDYKRYRPELALKIYTVWRLCLLFLVHTSFSAICWISFLWNLSSNSSVRFSFRFYCLLIKFCRSTACPILFSAKSMHLFWILVPRERRCCITISTIRRMDNFLFPKSILLKPSWI